MEFLDSFSPGSTKRTHLYAAQQRKLKRLLVEQDIDAGLFNGSLTQVTLRGESASWVLANQSPALWIAIMATSGPDS